MTIFIGGPKHGQNVPREDLAEAKRVLLVDMLDEDEREEKKQLYRRYTPEWGCPTQYRVRVQYAYIRHEYLSEINALPAIAYVHHSMTIQQARKMHNWMFA